MVFGWGCFGLHILIIMREFSAGSVPSFAAALGGFTLAWAVGLLVVFAPAGAGAREIVLVAVLTPVLGVDPAIILAIISRVLLTASDLSLAALAVLATRRRRGAWTGDGDVAEATVS
jgi:hypothetical protein